MNVSSSDPAQVAGAAPSDDARQLGQQPNHRSPGCCVEEEQQRKAIPGSLSPRTTSDS
jgi:hypothetical protein